MDPRAIGGFLALGILLIATPGFVVGSIDDVNKH